MEIIPKWRQPLKYRTLVLKPLHQTIKSQKQPSDSQSAAMQKQPRNTLSVKKQLDQSAYEQKWSANTVQESPIDYFSRKSSKQYVIAVIYMLWVLQQRNRSSNHGMPYLGWRLFGLLVLQWLTVWASNPVSFIPVHSPQSYIQEYILSVYI